MWRSSRRGVGGGALRDRFEQCPVVVVDGWPVGLSAENHELVAKHVDLEVLERPERTASRASAAKRR